MLENHLQKQPLTVNGRISYIGASEEPLCADIGIIGSGEETWLFDVGNGEENISCLTGDYSVVLSHFHADHIGNLDRIRAKELFVSKETYGHTHRGTVVSSDLYFGDLHIFPLPSSHAKGCLGLEVGGEYAFVGDGLYCRIKDGFYVYNATLLKEEIDVLQKLRAPYLLVSHHRGLVRKKDLSVRELISIYEKREKNNPEIKIRIK